MLAAAFTGYCCIRQKWAAHNKPTEKLWWRYSWTLLISFKEDSVQIMIYDETSYTYILQQSDCPVQPKLFAAILKTN